LPQHLHRWCDCDETRTDIMLQTASGWAHCAKLN